MWRIHGNGGRLRCGARSVALLGKWEAWDIGGGRYRLSATEAQRDPIGWDNHDPERLVAVLCMRTTDVRLKAQIVEQDPLIMEVWNDED